MSRELLIDGGTLAAAGYRPDQVPVTRHASAFYQKCIREGVVKLYFINAYVYLSPRPDFPDGVEFEVRLFPEALDDHGFDLSLPWAGEIGVKRAEAFIAKAYAALGCVPDRHNND